MASNFLCLGLFLPFLLQQSFAAFNYGDALTKSLLYFEAQRSGKLPPNQRVQWRANSALTDGGDGHVNLVGGYYDAGDNVKFGFPMAFTVTLLAWSAVEFGNQLAAKNELSHALDAVKWGTDYLIDAHPEPDVLYGEVGDGNSDHNCWERPEDMTTPRTSYRIDNTKPGADLAGETAAAMAAASIAFQNSNPTYSATLLNHAKQLFDFGRNHPGLYQNSIPVVTNFYSSSGFDDELLWAAAWLHRATNDQAYLDYLAKAGDIGGTRSEFSWDDKFVGAQTLVAKLVLEGKVGKDGVWAQYKNSAEQFICSCIQKGSNNVRKTPGGLLYFLPWNDLQYTTSALLLITAYSKYLTATRSSLQCQAGLVQPGELITFAQSQVDYILGANPRHISYMVGFGSAYPLQVHHRASSIVSIKKDGTPVSCQDGFKIWFNKNAPNPNVLDGAIVGGPDANDAYIDLRSNFQQAEPATVTTAPFVGVLAGLA
ncbi:endoglucanase 14-like [Magnolia sinica]|uniref:endoglucanase 14-like n=1 Tax=Magnolia sinica TaxID=86752 RepID=UPI00265AE50E|nr:endoglucanase 14-like [Magnolia sinica]